MADTNRNGAKKALAALTGRSRTRQPRQVVALELDDTLLRVVVCARRGEGGDFERIAAAPLPLPGGVERPGPEVLGKAIAAALARLRLSPGSVVLGVPRGQVMLRTVSLPQLNDVRELASMVQLQIGKDLPYRKDDAVVDFELRPATPQQKPGEPPAPEPGAAQAGAGVPAEPDALEALVAVAQRDIVEFYRKTCAAAGLKLSALSLLPHANVRCLTACGAATPDQVLALVSLRRAEVSVDVMLNDRLLFSRGALLMSPEDDATEAGPDLDRSPAVTLGGSAEPLAANGQLTTVERITIEVVRSLHSFGGMTPDRAVGKVVVVGDTGEEPAVAEALGKKLTAPVTVLDVGAALNLDPEERTAAGGAVSAIGLALAATDAAGVPIDFLNPKRPAVQRDMKRVRLLAAAAAVMVLFASVLGVRAYLLRERMRIYQGVQQELSAVQKHQSIYRKTRVQAASINEWVREGRDWLEHYAYLTSILPPSEDVYLTSLTVSSQGTIRLAIQARSGEILANVDKQLRAAGYEVKPQAITPGADRYGYNFRSSVELIVPAKMKIDLSNVKPPLRPADDVSLNPPGKTAAARAGLPAVAVFGGGR